MEKEINVYNDLQNAGLVTKIYYDDVAKTARFENLNPNPYLCAFWIQRDITFDDLEYFLRERCFPETRANKDELLQLLDVPYYDPWLIVRRTKGRMVHDNIYLEFVGEEDVSLEMYR